MDVTILVTCLRGPVTVAYRKKNRKWYATALEFDLVGIGRTREGAFEILQEMVNEYLTDCVKAEKVVDFIFPSEPDEWNIEDKDFFSVTAIISQPIRQRREIPNSLNLSQLRPFKKQIQRFQLMLMPGMTASNSSLPSQMCHA
jgi:hypothetical protein